MTMTVPVARYGKCDPMQRRRMHSGTRGRSEHAGRIILVLALQQVVRELTQARGVGSENVECTVRGLGELVRLRPRSLQSHERGIGGLLRGRILPGALAEFFAGLRDVEDVVDDLEGE